MNKKLIIFGVAVLLICVGLSGCNELTGGQSSEEQKFVGTWKSDNPSAPHALAGISKIDFFSDGTFTSGGFLAGVYDIKDGKLVLTMGEGALVFPFDYYFSNSGNRLTLIDTNDNSLGFSKQ